MPNPSFSSNGTATVFSGREDASGNFAVGHVMAATAFISSNTVDCSATVGQPTLIVPFSANRTWVTICNRSTGSETIDLGTVTVTPGGGLPVEAGGDRTFTGPGAAGPIYAASPVAGTPISWVDA